MSRKYSRFAHFITCSECHKFTKMVPLPDLAALVWTKCCHTNGVVYMRDKSLDKTLP